MMSQHFKVIAALILSSCSSLPTQAAGKEITCYSTAFPPYVVQATNGDISGIDVDVARAAGEQAGLTIRFKLLPWVRLENEIRRGAASEIECAFAYTRNDERNTYMDFMQVPLKMTRYLIYTNSKNKSLALGDLKGKTIGLRRGFIVPGAFEEMRKRKELQIEEVDDDLTNFRKLSLNRIDAIVANADVGNKVLGQLNQTNIIASDTPIVETPTFLIFNKGKNLANLLPQLDKALLKLQQDGSVQKIREKYLLTTNIDKP